jgi:hypothetical protein
VVVLAVWAEATEVDMVAAMEVDIAVVLAVWAVWAVWEADMEVDMEVSFNKCIITTYLFFPEHHFVHNDRHLV